MKKILCIIGISVLSVVVFLLGLRTVNHFVKPNIAKDKDIVVYHDDYEMVFKYDYIFVAKVEEHTKTVSPFTSILSTKNIPYRYYDISIQNYLKGSNLDDLELCLHGGKDMLNFVYMQSNYSEDLSIGKYYLFFTYEKDNKLIINNKQQKLLLNDYNPDVSLDKQEIKTRQIIDKYETIVNKEIGNEILDIKTFDSNKSLFDYSTDVFITKVDSPNMRVLEEDYFVKNFYSDHNYNFEEQAYLVGEGSNIVSTTLNVSTYESFKSSDNEKHLTLFLYGINVYDPLSEGDFVTLPTEGFYLILANHKDSNCTNERILDEYLVIMDNYQMVYLKDYDNKKELKDQNQSVKDIISSYTGINY